MQNYYIPQDRLDIQHLLLPVTEDYPAGDNVRQHHQLAKDYYELRDARQNIRRLERDNNKSEPHAWMPVIKQSYSLLTHSKDTEVATWLLEGLIREFDLLGLHDGLLFINHLVTNFALQLHPQPDEDESLSAIVKPLENLFVSTNSALITPLNLISLVENTNISVWAYAQARTQGKDALANYVANLTNANLAKCEQSLAILKQIHLQISQLEQQMNDIFYASPISLRVLIDALNDMQQCMAHLQREQPVLEVREVKENTSTVVTTEISTQSSVLDYQKAMQQLRNISAFMAETQPHSIMTIGLCRLARWADMPMDALINELFIEDNVAMHVAHSIGIPQATSTRYSSRDD